MNDIDVLTYVVRTRLLSLFTIKKFMVGYDTETDRVAFPIKSRTGEFVNIKLHNSNKDPKSISWAKGFGKPRLYPMASLLHRQITICEGEFDCLLLITLGVNAITSTGGAGQSFVDNRWCAAFKGHEVTVLFDSDPAGQDAQRRISEELRDYASTVRTVEYPKRDPDNGAKIDVTTFIKDGGDIKKLLGVSK